MSDDNFRAEDVLSMFRGMEQNEDAIPILDDDDAMKCLAAWAKTDQAWRRPKRDCPAMSVDNHAAVWRWVLAGWTLDVEGVAKAAGISERTAQYKLDVLTCNRLIYPDGSMAKGARLALNIYVAKKLGIKQKQPPQRSAPRTTPTPTTPDGDDNSN